MKPEKPETTKPICPIHTHYYDGNYPVYTPNLKICQKCQKILEIKIKEANENRS